MSEPEITVKAVSYVVPISLVGHDEQGRVTYTCPNFGCGETGHIEASGELVCPSCTSMRLALEQMMRDAMNRLEGQ